MDNQPSLVQNFNPGLSPVFDRSPLVKPPKKVNFQRWPEVEEAFEKKDFKKLILGILHYLDSTVVSRFGNQDRTEFRIPHGSILVNIKIGDTHLTITAPFLKLTGGGANIPLLRQVTEINIKKLGLPEILLREDRLEFFFQCPLELCHPDKIYDVLYQVCSYADEYDDVFIDEFGAERLYQPVIRRFPQASLEAAWERFRFYLQEAMLYYNHFESSRQYVFCLHTIAAVLKKIHYYLDPQGVFNTDIEKTLSYLDNRDITLRDRIHKGMAFLESLQQIDKNRVLDNLYSAETLIPIKRYLSHDELHKNLGECCDTVEEFVSAHDHIQAVLLLTDFFYNMLYYYDCPNTVQENIINTLLRAANKPWPDASETLWDMAVRMLNAG